MKTVKRTITVYLDMFPIESDVDSAFGCAYIAAAGSPNISIGDGWLRNRVEIEVYVPVKNETIDLGKAEAVKVE